MVMQTDQCAHLALDVIWSFGDIAIFIYQYFASIMAHTRLFSEVEVGSMYPQMISPITHRICVESRRLSNEALTLVQRFDLGAGWSDCKVVS